MKKRNLILLAGGLGIVALAAFVTRSSWTGGGASAQGPQRARVISVEMAKAERKPVPVDVDAIGTVTPISSVALKSRVETTIVSVHFEDGNKVNEGDLLFTLDARQIDAQIEQAEGMLAKDQAQLEGAQRDHRRYSDLIGKGATTQVNLDNAKTQADILIGTIKADQSALDNLKVQKSYTIIRAPFSGRISVANVKVGNFVRPADTAPLAVINQMAPVYVTFAIPQRVLVDLRDAMTTGASKVIATIPGRQGRDGRELGRFHHRDGHGARHHGQCERDIVARDSGEHQAYHSEREFRRCADRSGATQPEWQLRVRGEGWRGQGSAGEGRPHLPGHIRDR